MFSISHHGFDQTQESHPRQWLDRLLPTYKVSVERYKSHQRQLVGISFQPDKVGIE